MTLLSDKNGKLKVLLYDNNIDVTNGDSKTSGKYSQAVQYTIDTKKMTIKQTWSYGKSLGKANFTRVIGSAQRLSNGNTLMTLATRTMAAKATLSKLTVTIIRYSI